MSKQNNDKTASDSDLSMSAGSEYLPEMVVIRKDWIYKGTSAIRNGRDSLQAELFRHDRELGRSILRNKRDAEDMERDIAKMDTAIRLLNDFIPENRLVLSPPKPKNSMNTETENPPTDSDNAPSAEAVDSNALFACPFCGGDPKLIRVGNDHTRKRSVRIECSTFGCTVKMTVGAIRYSHDWCENVIREKWNTRLNANVKADSREE